MIGMNARFRPFVLLLAVLVARPASGYDFPLSPSAIREAYFLGSRQASLGATFLAEYAHEIPNLKAGAFTSEARIGLAARRVTANGAEHWGCGVHRRCQGSIDGHSAWRRQL